MATKEKKPLLLCGDFNIDLLKNSSASQDFISSLQTSNFTHLISHPTRETSHSSTCIDNIVTNIPHKVISSGVIQTDISDHYALFTVINEHFAESTLHQKTSAYRRIYSESNQEHFFNKISSEAWSSIFSETDVDKKYNNFINIFTQHIDACFPLKLTNLSTMKKNPWFNSEAKQLNNLKYSFLKLSKLYPCIQPAYYTLQKLYNNTIRQIKRNYYNNLFLKSSNDPRKTWKTLNHLTGRSITKATKPLTLHNKTKSTSDPTEVAQLLNNHFCTIGDALNLNNTSADGNPPTAHILPRHYNSFALFDITKEEIIKSVKELKSNASPGYDEITPKLLKLTLPLISEVLLDIFNSSFRNGIFPSRMKIAKVVPIFKKGNRSDVNNYRPISLLPILSKCLEKIMFNRLNSFLIKNKIITSVQFGFTKNKSTVDAMIEFVDKIAHHSKTKHTLSIFCDLSKAFDCVNHNILLNKLHTIGIRGPSHKWFQSYLSSRNQFTTITETSISKSGNHSIIINHSSNLKHVVRGVPQGSILGPLLFNIYINDLPQTNFNRDDYILYADDTSIILSANDPTALKNGLNSALSNTITWLKANQLSLNLTKTNFMYINPKNHAEIPISTTDTANNIQKTEQTKFLGLHISSNLSWTHHITHVISKVRPGIAMLYKLKSVVESKTLLRIYFSLIHSHLNYAILIWGDAPLTHLTKLLKLQKKAIRIILHKSPLTSCRPLFKELSILTITSIYILEASCYAKKLLLRHNQHTSHQSLQTTSEMHQHCTRQQNNIYIPNNRKLDIKSKCSIIYNKLPAHLKTIPTIHKFRLSTKKYLLENTLYSIKEFKD